MLDADALPVVGMVGVRDVAGGEHARHAGAQPIVDEDPVVDGEPRVRGQLRARLDPDADDHEVAFEHAAVAGPDPLHRAPALEGLHAVAEQQLDALVGVHVAVHGAQLGAEHPLERHRDLIDERDLQPALAGGGGDLGPDPAGADHDNRPAAVEPRAERVGVRHRAQGEHALQIGAGDAEPARLGARGQQERVVFQRLAAVEGQPPRRRVERLGGAAEAQLDVVLVVEALLVDVDLVAAGLAAEVVLGERRPLVGPLLLGADQHHAPVEALLAQRLGGLGAGKARSGDHERLGCGHRSSCG